MEKKTIDIIIPTYKPDAKFDKLIHRLEKQTVRPNHIYVLNTEESFFASEEVSKYDNITVSHIRKYEFDHGGTRNLGASLSDAEFLLFMTQDAIPKDNYLVEKLLGAFDDSEVAAAYARQLADAKDNYIEYYTRLFNYPKQSMKKTKADLETLGIKTFFCSNVCAMYRRSDYEAQGGFVLHAIFNEDMILASSLIASGKAIVYEADAKVWHWHNYTGLQQLKRNFDLGVSQAQAKGLFEQVKSEKEGVKLVLSTCKHMLFHGRVYLIPKVIWTSACKFIGFQLGRRYRHLPKNWIRKLTSNPDFWNTYWDWQRSL